MLVLTGLRLAVAAALPLSGDEAYYRIWSQALAGGYLDHPPMVALWIRAGTTLLGDSALGVRLLAPLAAAAGSVLLADAGRVLFGWRAGVWAALLLNATLMLGVGAVTMTPDTPLLLFWTAAAWALARVAAGGGGAGWLLAGAAAGLAFDSKYTAALLLPGVAAWLLLPAGRPWLRRGSPWAGAALGAALTAPVLLWNARHGWASFAKQGGRVGEWSPSLRFLVELLGGQIGLATPLVFGLFGLGVAAAVRRWRSGAGALIAALVLPGAAVFVQHALGDRVQANWVAVLYPGGALAAGGLLAAPGARGWFGGRRGGVLAVASGMLLTGAVYLQAVWSPLPLPRSMDPTLRLAGWPELATELGRRAEGAAFVASEEYGAAALLAWHAPGLTVLGVEPRWRLFDLPAAQVSGPGLVLVSARRREDPDPAAWSDVALVGTLVRQRNGMEAEAYRLYRATLKADAPAVRLPPRRMPHADADTR